MSETIEISMNQLRGMIGVRMIHRGRRYVVVEVLEDGPSIVLQEIRDNRNIQDNLHGMATRRVVSTVTVPVLTPDHRQIHADYLALELID
ncbi:MAG: hypothetical protein DSZ33_00475 [Gammaproteobacteria bacterium]|nr:MAG: hypothetical protein DSZ33_00475 [Gammaproteobacteria bacterium]